MSDLPSHLVIAALTEIGRGLPSRTPPVELVFAGGMAGLLGGHLRPSRTTADCDVMWISDAGAWPEIELAAQRVGGTMGLPPAWLNRRCAMYAWHLPLGWRERCEPVGSFGGLRVSRLSRFDLIGTKLMGAPRRPQDLEDLRDLRPTREECDRAAAHLDRLTSESLDGESFDDQRMILRALRAEHDDT